MFQFLWFWLCLQGLLHLQEVAADRGPRHADLRGDGFDGLGLPKEAAGIHSLKKRQTSAAKTWLQNRRCFYTWIGLMDFMAFMDCLMIFYGCLCLCF